MKYIFKDVRSRHKVDRTKKSECDIYIPELRVGIEVDGQYWHRNKFKQDKEKYIFLKSKGVSLFRVRGKGLKRISDTDVPFSEVGIEKDGYLVVIHCNPLGFIYLYIKTTYTEQIR